MGSLEGWGPKKQEDDSLHWEGLALGSCVYRVEIHSGKWLAKGGVEVQIWGCQPVVKISSQAEFGETEAGFHSRASEGTSSPIY